MKLDRRLLAEMRKLCADIGPDDGLPTRKRAGSSRGADRKRILKLCGQVFRILNLALAASRDPTLQSLELRHVEPAPDASRLRVSVTSQDPGQAGALLERLERAKGWLRQEVASGIRRKKAPDLVFAYVPPEGGWR